MVIVKINIKPHLAEYMNGKFFDDKIEAVKLEDRDDLYVTISNLTSKRPLNAPIESGNLSIVLPYRRGGKNPEYWNYLGVRSVKAIERKIEIRFWAELHEYLDEQKHRYHIDYIVAIEAFMLQYNITSISDEALRKNYYRWRNRIRGKHQTRKYKKTVTNRIDLSRGKELSR